MSTPHLLVSGDYWHNDFRSIFSNLDAPATMVRLEKMNSVTSTDFLAIVLAQSRRDQFDQASVDALRCQFPDVPIVNLLGTWCEGENRSGKPLTGTTRVMWHQWNQQFNRFCRQIVEGVATDWHHPLTASVADRVRDFSPDPQHEALLRGKKVLVSAESTATFESLADMLSLYQCLSFWAEGSNRNVELESFDAILIDGNSASDDLLRRVGRLRETNVDVPVITLLNFPRPQCFASLAANGIEEVVSKPFTHSEILNSLTRAISNKSLTK